MKGDIAYWEDEDIWEIEGDILITRIDKKEICSRDGIPDGVLMLLPPNVDWYQGRELCRRFGGRLHIDSSLYSSQTRSIPTVEAGEKVRCSSFLKLSEIILDTTFTMCSSLVGCLRYGGGRCMERLRDW